MPDLARLRAEAEELAAALLPDDPDVTEPLPARERFLTNAYLVLTSALLEEFIEGCFVEFLDDALSRAGPDDVPRCFVPLATRFADDVRGQTHRFPPADEACPMLRGLYVSKVVGPNNGVKRTHIEALAKPLGLEGELDACEALLAPADTLGARRGGIAHLGTVEDELRPDSARILVTDVLDGLPLLVGLLGFHVPEAAESSS